VTSDLGSPTRTLRVAVVGAGPAGFYTTEALLRSERAIAVDLIDRLPTPYGLVRAGVAPDHQKLKAAIRVYEKIAQRPSFAFIGNVSVGRDVSIEELGRYYDAIVLSFGAETDKRLGIPGEDLLGSHTATEFVGWYNAHPDYRDRVFDFSCEVAVVIGQGNVAMDVSRILAKTVDELKATDIADYALDALSRSRIREVHLVGRRGPAQAKFTPPEIREIGELADCDPIVKPEDLVLNPESEAELADPENRHARDNVAILREFAARGAPAKRRRYFVRNFESPKEILGGRRVERIVLEKTTLSGPPFRQSAKGSGERVELACGLVLRSIGYSGIAMPGVPFDERAGVIPSAAGRVVVDGAPISGLYVAGWIKRGPTGVIGTNKPDGYETAESLLADVAELRPCPVPDTAALLELLRSRGIRTVSFDDFRRIDALEVARGKRAGKPREKFATVAEMLALLDGENPA
jgi:ferredoxin/flavodoxin---NADP+ reductase